jgi:hypothetical protein
MLRRVSDFNGNCGAIDEGGPVTIPFWLVSLADGSEPRDLFDRWERVWREGKFDLVFACAEIALA